MPTKTKLCSRGLKQAKLYRNFQNLANNKGKKGKKWPQINQVLLNSERKGVIDDYQSIHSSDQ